MLNCCSIWNLVLQNFQGFLDGVFGGGQKDRLNHLKKFDLATSVEGEPWPTETQNAVRKYFRVCGFG